MRIDSACGNETEVALVIADRLRKVGVKSRFFGEDKGRQGLIAKIRGDIPGRSLLLNGHLDTVPFGDLSKWRYPPLSAKVSGNRIYGRGTYDMKGGVAALTCSIIDVLQHDIPFSGGITLLLTYDEEKGHQGIKTAMKRLQSASPKGADTESTQCGRIVACVERRGGLRRSPEAVGLSRRSQPLFTTLKADGCIMAEPSKEALGIGYRGSYTFTIESIGKTAHSGSLITPGVNAVTKMAKILLALDKLKFRYKRHPLFPPPRINPGTVISGGTAANIIPDRCTATVNTRLSLGQTKITAIADVKTALVKLMKQDSEIRYRIHELNYTPPYMTPLEKDITCSARQAARYVLGHDPVIKVSGGASDGNHLSLKGIPTVNFGPKGARLHQENEYVEITSLIRCTRVYENVIVDYLRH